MSNGQTPNDNRLDVIARAREHLLLATNIISSPKEMEVLDDILFRAWQMGWLKQYDTLTNNDMKVRFKLLNDKAVMPRKAHPTDAGFDLVATSRVFDHNGNATYGTGIAIEIPEGYAGLIFPRSSICKYDLSLSNAVGLVDSCYRGEVFCKFKPTLLYIDKGVHGIDNQDYDGLDESNLDNELVSFHGRAENYPDVSEGCAPFPPRVYEIGDRIAQLVIIPIPEIEFEQADELTDSDRGMGGYGSTGR